MERRTTPVELLWDLVFVFAITRVSTLLSSDLTWAGAGRAALALALVWWAWSAFAWATNAEDPDSGALTAVLLAASVLSFLAGLALPHAFGRDAALFAIAYTGVRLLHLALYVDASHRGNASLRAISGFAVTVLVGMALLVAGAYVSPSARLALWIAAAAIDYAGPALLTRERLRGLQQVAVAHFAERYGLFVIICLGESIVAIGIGANVTRLDATTVVAVALALLIAIALWWTYFRRFAAAAEERLRAHADPVLAASDAYSYIHLLIVAGIIAFAVGARRTAAHPAHALTGAPRLALCGGVALYLLGHTAFQLRLLRRASAGQLFAALGALALFALGAHVAAWLLSGLLALVLLTTLASPAVALRSPRALARRPRA